MRCLGRGARLAGVVSVPEAPAKISAAPVHLSRVGGRDARNTCPRFPEWVSRFPGYLSVSPVMGVMSDRSSGNGDNLRGRSEQRWGNLSGREIFFERPVRGSFQ